MSVGSMAVVASVASADLSRAASQALGRSVWLSFGVLAAVALFVTAPLAVRWRRPTLPTAAALIATAFVVAVTMRPGVGGWTPAFRPGDALGWLRGDWSRAIVLDPPWLLNVLLFVPLGAAWAWLSQRPAYTAGGVLVATVAIETLQGLLGRGASDPADVVANLLGGLVGIPIGMIAPTRAADGRAGLRPLALPCVIAALMAGLGFAAIQIGADGRRANLRDDLAAEWADTDFADLQAAFDGSSDEVDLVSPLFARTEVRPDYLLVSEDGLRYEARYTTELLGAVRCVFVVWTVDGRDFRESGGDDCTVFRDRLDP